VRSGILQAPIARTQAVISGYDTLGNVAIATTYVRDACATGVEL
jgi:hypothetical protein